MLQEFERVCSRLIGQPHFYAPSKAAEMMEGLGPRLFGNNVTIINGEQPSRHSAFANGRPSAGILGDRMGRAYDRYGLDPFDVVDGVAIIPIEGTLVQKGAWIGQSSGQTSYQGLQVQVARAERQSNVKGVAFEVDSFGGQVNGAFQAAAAIRKLSAVKPTIAILSDYAYSAGYLLASQARQIVMPPEGGAGSIGVVMIHADYSGKLEQEGIKLTFIHSGEKKVDGNPYQALAGDLRDKWKSQIDESRQGFAAAVGQGRGKRFTKAQALATEAATYSAKEAKDLGIVDGIGDPVAALDAFIKEMKKV